MIKRVESYTHPGTFYDLTIKSGIAVACSCPDCINRERVCKHMKDYNSQVAATLAIRMSSLVQNVLAQYRDGDEEPEGARTLEFLLGLDHEGSEAVTPEIVHRIILEIRVA